MSAPSNTAADPGRDLKVTGLISVGHMFSHFYILVLPPLFPLLRGEYGVSYTALGAALAVLNVTTALTQAPCGFLVDRFGARWILIAGLATFALAIALVGAFPTYPALVALMALAGLGNSVFHPADYAILAASIRPERMGRAFSIHTFGGYVGFAAAPVVVVFLTELFGWRAALLISGLGGVLFALVMLISAGTLRDDGERAGHPPARRTGADVRLLLSPPVMLALIFFVMISLGHNGASGFTVAALEGLYAVPLVEANVPLTAYLFAAAAGVLAGGWIADRTSHHDRAVAVYMVLTGVAVALIALATPPLLLVAILLGIAGFFSGAVAPSRDMMVRAVTPPGASGKVFGFVTTGFNLGGVATPLLFGLLLDFGDARVVFWLIALISFATVAIVFAAGRSARTRPAAAGAAD